MIEGIGTILIHFGIASVMLVNVFSTKIVKPIKYEIIPIKLPLKAKSPAFFRGQLKPVGIVITSSILYYGTFISTFTSF
jgi:hypothetical protein